MMAMSSGPRRARTRARTGPSARRPRRAARRPGVQIRETLEDRELTTEGSNVHSRTIKLRAERATGRRRARARSPDCAYSCAARASCSAGRGGRVTGAADRRPSLLRELVLAVEPVAGVAEGCRRTRRPRWPRGAGEWRRRRRSPGRRWRAWRCAARGGSCRARRGASRASCPRRRRWCARSEKSTPLMRAVLRSVRITRGVRRSTSSLAALGAHLRGHRQVARERRGERALCGTGRVVVGLRQCNSGRQSQGRAGKRQRGRGRRSHDHVLGGAPRGRCAVCFGAGTGCVSNRRRLEP